MPCLQPPRNGHFFYIFETCVLKMESENTFVKANGHLFSILFAGEDPAGCLSSGGPKTPAQIGSSRIPGRGQLSLGPAGNLPLLLSCNMSVLKGF